MCTVAMFSHHCFLMLYMYTKGLTRSNLHAASETSDKKSCLQYSIPGVFPLLSYLSTATFPENGSLSLEPFNTRLDYFLADGRGIRSRIRQTP